MAFFKQFIVVILSFLLAVSLLLLPLCIAVYSTILNEKTITSLLEELDYTEIIDNAIEQTLFENLPDKIHAESLAIFKKEISKVSRENAVHVFHDFYRYINNASNNFNPVIDLGELKQSIKIEFQNSLKKSVNAEYYNKNNKNIDQEFEEFWKNISAQIPNTINIMELMKNNEIDNLLPEIKKGIKIFKIIQTCLIIYLIISMITIGLLKARLKLIFLCFSKILTTTGVLVGIFFLLYLVLYKFNSISLNQFSLQGIPADKIFILIKKFFHPWFIFTIIYLVAGIGMQITGNILKTESIQPGTNEL